MFNNCTMELEQKVSKNGKKYTCIKVTLEDKSIYYIYDFKLVEKLILKDYNLNHYNKK